MNTIIKIQPLTKADFTPFGEVIEVQAQPTMMINEDNCARYHDLAELEFSNARVGISVFHAQPYSLPYSLRMLERHPLGSQAFLPFTDDPFLVIVAEDDVGTPMPPRAFLTNGQQGVNYRRNTWHGVLTALAGPGIFAVVDRIGGGDNLQEHWFESPYSIVA